MNTTYTTTINSSSGSGSLAALGVIWIVILLIGLVGVIASWRIYRKAGQPGWASLIPIYNAVFLMRIVGRPGWWVLLLLIPVINVVISIIVAIDLAKAFGRSDLFGIVGLWLFSLVGYFILAFGKSTYVGPGSGSNPLTTDIPQGGQSAFVPQPPPPTANTMPQVVTPAPTTAPNTPPQNPSPPQLG